MSNLLLGFDIGGAKRFGYIGRYEEGVRTVENTQAIPTDLAVSSKAIRSRSD